jgi:hypothetical protein
VHGKRNVLLAVGEPFDAMRLEAGCGEVLAGKGKPSGVVILSNGVVVENGSSALGNAPILIGLGPGSSMFEIRASFGC